MPPNRSRACTRAAARAIRVRQWAVADNVTLFQSMTDEENLANFGGPARVTQLMRLFSDLKEADIRLYIVSIGFSSAFGPAMEKGSACFGLIEHICEVIGNVYTSMARKQTTNFVNGWMSGQSDRQWLAMGGCMLCGILLYYYCSSSIYDALVD